jgi:hypothetical protein
VDASVAAQILDGFLTNACDLGLRELVAPPPAELRDWFKQIEADAKSLVENLGLDPEPCARGEIGPHAGSEMPALDHLCSGLSIRDLPLRSLPRELEQWLHGSKTFEAEFAIRKHYWKRAYGHELTGAEQVNLITLITCLGALWILPDVLGVLIAKCRKGAQVATSRSKGRGRRKDSFSTEFFIGLARTHDYLFGCKPRYRDNEREPNDPAVNLARQLLQIAKERVPNAFIGNPVPLVASIDEDLALSSGRLANLIHEGCRGWEEAKAHLKEIRHLLNP